MAADLQLEPAVSNSPCSRFQITEASPFVHSLLNRGYLFVVVVLAVSHGRLFSPALAILQRRERRRRRTRRLFTLVTMNTASQKSLRINTESTWCEYVRELSSVTQSDCFFFLLIGVHATVNWCRVQRKETVWLLDNALKVPGKDNSVIFHQLLQIFTSVFIKFDIKETLLLKILFH